MDADPVDPTTSETSTPKAAATTIPISQTSTSDHSLSKTQSAIDSLNSILPTIPCLTSSSNPALSLLHDTETATQISSLLRKPNSGSGDDNLSRWLYETFQSGDPNLQLIVLRFIPIVVGVYLSRVSHRKSLAGFEAVLLALYAHETTSRAGEPLNVHVADMSHPSVYHEIKTPINNSSTGLNLVTVSPALEPSGTVRSTRRARIVGVALELYYSKIQQIPAGSKIEFCEFCRVWTGQDGKMYKEGGETESESKEGRIPLPWELLQLVMRILGHCLLGPEKNKEVIEVASDACRSLYARSMHDIESNAILSTGSLVRLVNMGLDSNDAFDHTEVPNANIIKIFKDPHLY